VGLEDGMGRKENGMGRKENRGRNGEEG